MRTFDDVAHQVRETLGGEVGDFDVEGITSALIERFGRVGLDTVPTFEYWQIVKAHDIAGGGENTMPNDFPTWDAPEGFSLQNPAHLREFATHLLAVADALEGAKDG